MCLWRSLVLVWLITIWIYKAQSCDEFTDLDFHDALIGTSLKVRLLLYTRVNITCGLLLPYDNISAQYDFNVSRPTTFVIHGYRLTGSPPKWLDDIEQLLLAREDMNVITVDWNNGAATLNYMKAVENTFKVADQLTTFIQAMQEHGASLKSLHLIGISLGAHISGFVGAKLNGKIGRITALDPAGPQFVDTDPAERLDPSDAEFVDVIHSDVDALGFREQLGHIDFYANGGADQPGCPRTIFSGTEYFKCDHQRSVYLYLESLRGTCPIRSFPCASYADFLDGRCTSCEGFGAVGCPVFGYDIVNWKEPLLTLHHTKAFFSTNQKSPFCRVTYVVDMLTWNQDTCWGYVTITLHGDREAAVATIDHKASRFSKYTMTRLLAQFNKDLKLVQMVSIKFSSGNAVQPKSKLRVLRIQLQHLERQDRSLCRYDVILEEDEEVSFKAIPCE